MDKYQRRAIRKWEDKKAKSQHKFDEYTRLHSYQHTQAVIDRAVEAYTPPGDVTFAKARVLSSNPYFVEMSRDIVLPHDWNRYHMRYMLMSSSRVRLFRTDMDIAAEIAEQKQEKDVGAVNRLARVLLCHQARVNAMRHELLVKTTRLRAIQNCRNGFKEELMMAVWHPRRVEKLIETYGWEAYDNLLGVE